MSISKQWVAVESNRANVLRLYRGSELLTTEQIAEELGTTFHNVSHVIRTGMTEHERRTLAKVRYSVSKSGTKNPMQGKTREAHHNWQGECEDGCGYLTILVANGEREFVHRAVMAEALGLAKLPRRFDVHHIDEDKKNNALDNLALVSRRGHKEIHARQSEGSQVFKSRRSTIADALRYMTSP